MLELQLSSSNANRLQRRLPAEGPQEESLPGQDCSALVQGSHQPGHLCPRTRGCRGGGTPAHGGHRRLPKPGQNLSQEQCHRTVCASPRFLTSELFCRSYAAYRIPCGQRSKRIFWRRQASKPRHLPHFKALRIARCSYHWHMRSRARRWQARRPLPQGHSPLRCLRRRLHLCRRLFRARSAACRTEVSREVAEPPSAHIHSTRTRAAINRGNTAWSSYSVQIQC